MTYSSSGRNGDKNAHLLLHLVKKHGAIGLGAISGFFEVDENWHCPSCHRGKEDIARLDKNGELFCQMVPHHDHMDKLANGKIPTGEGLEWSDRQPAYSVRENFRRFQETLICTDCNVVEGDAKKKVSAPSEFSFTPFEISTFIIVEPNRGHLLDMEVLAKTWEKIQPSLWIYGNTLRGIAKTQIDPGGFEQVGGAALRVLAALKKKMDEKK